MPQKCQTAHPRGVFDGAGEVQAGNIPEAVQTPDGVLMHRCWLPIVCAAVLVAGCGSPSGSDTATPDPPSTATVRSPDLRRLSQAPDPSGRPPSSQGVSRNAFLRAVFDDVEALWQREFRSAGLTYRPARLTIFSQQVRTACGPGATGSGPFYCPASFGVYLDPTFFAALSRKVAVDIGDFAQAYVVAHEIGHHVQTLLGITRSKAAADKRDPAGVNARSVRFELQADCLAGVWMHSVYRRGQLTDADLQDTLNAAAVVGDDFQRSGSGRIRPPEQWTHGSSAQRQRWLMTGFEQGTPGACDTFDR
jgi:predicted metalloprotease